MTNDAESDGLPPVPRRAASLLAAFPGVQSLHVSTCASITPEKSAQNPWQQMAQLFCDRPSAATIQRILKHCGRWEDPVPHATPGPAPPPEPFHLDPEYVNEDDFLAALGAN